MLDTLWKGKGREEAHGTEEPNPFITYRHLLSNLGVRNPLRAIGLCDMDAFYAACEQVRLGIDPSEQFAYCSVENLPGFHPQGIPLVVRQWDSLIAVNYPARSYNISRMDKVASALERCPHLRVVHVATYNPSAPGAKPTYADNPSSQTHKVSLDHYRRESKKIIEVFKDVLPGAEVEKASIDEAFIDFTEPVRQHILCHLPELANPPPEGLDSPLPQPPRKGVPLPYLPACDDNGKRENIWSGLGTLVPVSLNHRDLHPSEEVRDMGVVDDTGAEPSAPALVASRGRSQSAEPTEVELEAPPRDDDENCQPGAHRESQFKNVPDDVDRPPTWHDIFLSIAASLMLKMRDEVKTRLGYTTSAGIARNKFLAKLVSSYKKRDSQTILRNAAIQNYLAPLPFQKIRFLGGKLGTAIAEEYDARTVGDLLGINIEEMRRKFGESSIWVWEALRGIDRSEVKEKSLVTKSMGASKNLQHPITHPSQGAHWLRILAGELAFRLAEAREDDPGLWPKTLVLHVRQSYETARSKQTPFPFTRAMNMDLICKAAEKLWTELIGTGPEYDRNKAEGRATGMKITNIFLGFSGVGAGEVGQQKIEGFLPSSSGKRKSDGDVRDEAGKRKKATSGDEDGSTTSMGDSTSETAVSFRCGRCDKLVRRYVDGMVDQEAILEALTREHDDFHFAQDLAWEDDGGHHGSSAMQDKKAKKTEKTEPKGIAKFFVPK